MSASSASCSDSGTPRHHRVEVDDFARICSQLEVVELEDDAVLDSASRVRFANGCADICALHGDAEAELANEALAWLVDHPSATDAEVEARLVELHGLIGSADEKIEADKAEAYRALQPYSGPAVASARALGAAAAEAARDEDDAMVAEAEATRRYSVPRSTA